AASWGLRRSPARIKGVISADGGTMASRSFTISLSLGGMLKLLLAALSLLLIAALGIMATGAWRQYQTATHVHRIDAGAALLLRAEVDQAATRPRAEREAVLKEWYPAASDAIASLGKLWSAATRDGSSRDPMVARLTEIKAMVMATREYSGRERAALSAALANT